VRLAIVECGSTRCPCSSTVGALLLGAARGTRGIVELVAVGGLLEQTRLVATALEPRLSPSPSGTVSSVFLVRDLPVLKGGSM